MSDPHEELPVVDTDDLGDCPYFARWNSIPGHNPHATCSYGCYDEPECVTCEPHGGWPAFRTIIAALPSTSTPEAS